MSHCLCGVCKECRERAKQIVELMKKAEEFGKKHNCSPLVYFKLLEDLSDVLEEAIKKREEGF